jgi:hypothetical protein
MTPMGHSKTAEPMIQDEMLFGIKALLTAKNEREAFKKFVAYVLFEPGK